MQRWSTVDAPPPAQFTRWRELICEAFLDLTPESDLRDGFAGTVTQWPLGAMSIARIDSQRQRVRRTARDIARVPQPGFYTNFQVRGSSLMTQHGRSTLLRPGDLAAVALDEPVAPWATPVRHDGLHAAALADIDEHLIDDDLSPPATARRLNVSVRLLHAVFAGRQRTFGAEVRRRRLEVAWRTLRDPAHAHLRIIDVAVEAGFTNVTSFHRAFRHAYGRTPAAVRGPSRPSGGGVRGCRP